MDATWSRGDIGTEWTAATDLAEHIAAGGELPSIPSPVLLNAGEMLHADLPAHGWRFEEADVSYVAPCCCSVWWPRWASSRTPFPVSCATPGSAPNARVISMASALSSAAIVLAHLEPRAAADVLSMLPPECQEDVIYRVATLGPVSAEALDDLEATIDCAAR